jgi:quaternary ammonium compound-resistance protein SugE
VENPGRGSRTSGAEPGVGAALTVGAAMVTGAETVSLVKILLVTGIVTGIVACVVGLELLH